MKKLLLSAAVVLACATAVGAQQNRRSELSLPIVAFTPLVAKNADALGLNDAQRADVKAWLGTMPAQRKALEAQATEARAKLRAAIISGAPVEERQALAEEVGANETRLVMMRSNCTDHWRSVLTADQFETLLNLAKAQ
ncbi:MULTISPECIES: Spy/CpxP family protein refolding chaperone [Actibacterium]|uniref:Spy/CpxP family protein refolding chaperone n=1 Tax=Actibacterium naphthalenivorans TaxID=1614693 RepID=A0A840CHE8_9RHOB|nr:MULTISPECIES: Spy/CpxP family protein refolding chaperone [Actibacterium]MBB4022669.1 Spy/CpxP family protein refolding chaperone [Actibacterium naphthalenivorans]